MAVSVTERREADYIAYQRFERDRRRRNEETDASERLSMPMESTFDFKRLQNGDLLSDHGENLRSVIQGGYERAKRIANQNSDWVFERDRRLLDLAELDAVSKLEPGEVIVKFSPIPDEVRYGPSSVTGYNRQRNKMLVRISARGVDERQNIVSITSLSLDGSDYEAMQAAARAIGCSVPDGLDSEQVFAMLHRLDAEQRLQPSEVCRAVCAGYDADLRRQFGGEWYAGLPVMERRDALAFVRSQPDLIHQHMDEIARIQALALDDEGRAAMLERTRQDFAAALDDRRHGRQVASIEESGADARAEGRNYEGDCPTDVRARSAQAQAQQLGFKTGEVVMRCVQCPICGRQGVDAIATEGGGLRCSSCNKSTNGERDNAPPSVISRSEHRSAQERQPASRLPSGVEVVREIGIGDEKFQLVDKKTGQVVMEGVAVAKMLQRAKLN